MKIYSTTISPSKNEINWSITVLSLLTNLSKIAKENCLIVGIPKPPTSSYNYLEKYMMKKLVKKFNSMWRNFVLPVRGIYHHYVPFWGGSSRRKLSKLSLKNISLWMQYFIWMWKRSFQNYHSNSQWSPLINISLLRITVIGDLRSL